jgi:N-acetylmuramidase
MANFLKASRLDEPLARHDWAAFARGYNGPEFSRNQYDTRLAAAFRNF